MESYDGDANYEGSPTKRLESAARKRIDEENARDRALQPKEDAEVSDKEAKERHRRKNEALIQGRGANRVGGGRMLSPEEKESRVHASILATLRSVIKARRTLRGHQITSVKAFFALIDTDSSGTVDTSEFTLALTRLGLGLDEEAVSRLGKALDTDGDGMIDGSEFEAFMKSGALPTPKSKDLQAAGDGGAAIGGIADPGPLSYI